MSEVVEGFVARLETKNGGGGNTGKRAWTLYSARVELVSGEEYPEWVGFGFDPPPFKEGDYIRVEVEKVNGRMQYIKGSGSQPKNPPARKAKEVATPAGNKASSVEGFNRQTNPIDAERMTYASSRGDAIAVVTLLLANKALPIGKADTAAGTAARFEEITKAIDKLTVQYARDALTQRLFATVVDAGEQEADTKADGPIPPVETGKVKDGQEKQSGPDTSQW